VTGQALKRSPWVAASPLLTSPTPGFTSPATSSAPPGLRQRRAGEPEPASTSSFHDQLPDDGMPRASISVSSFTELELEADSLLHAVEMAALAGMRQRAAAEAAAEAPPTVAASVGEGDEETVFSLTEEFVEDAPPPDALPNIPLFSDLPRDAFIELFERCPLRRFGAGELILEQGSQGDAFYVICEGRVRVFREDGGQRKQLAILEGGAFFGEMAILSGAPRTASVESADEDAQLLEISAPVLADLSGRYPQVAKALKKFCRERLLSNVMNTSPLFRVLGRKDRRELIERFRARDVRRNEVIIRDGESTDGLYVVLSGEVEVHKQNQLLTRLKEGDLFGEISLLQKTPATATVSASRHTTILRLPREDFDRLIMSYPQILALVSELSDERLRRTEQVLGGLPAKLDSSDDELILV
jgi:CRP-like cAMP-binding protein